MVRTGLRAPSRALPRKKSQYRFKDRTIGVCAEWREAYRPGGFHPIDIGDKLHEGRYTVMRKLGYGGYSTVWLAEDTREDDYVAIKVLVAEPPAGLIGELAIYRKLQEGTTGGSAGVCDDAFVKLLHHFVEKGPNGKHICLVFEVMGPSVFDLTVTPQKFGETSMTKLRDDYLMPLWLAKRSVKSLVRGVASLHARGIVHGDLHTCNLLLKTKNLSTTAEENLTQPMSDYLLDCERLERLDGRNDLWAPEYLHRSYPLHDLADLSHAGATIKISDAGGAFLSSKPPKEIHTPGSYRCPETTFGLKFNEKIDIWSVGCSIFEILAGRSLFAIDDSVPIDTDEFVDDAMTSFTDRLGPLPGSLTKRWRHRERYYDSQWTKIRGNVEQATDEEVAADKEDEIFVFDSLEQVFRENRSEDMGDEEAEQVIMLLRSLLRYLPEERPSMAQVLKNPWVAGL